MRSASSKTILFDFDGTLCDSFNLMMESFRRNADFFRYRKLDPSEYAHLRGLPTQEVLKSVQISRLKLPFVVRAIRKEMGRELNQIVPFEKIREVLQFLRARGDQLGIVTSNSQENVVRFNQAHGMDVFDFIYSGTSLFGKAKMLKRVLKEREIFPDQVTYVGDETRDIEAARVVGISIAAVSWGYNNRTVLEKYRPDYLFDQVEELKQIQ